jgi:hypothetical protein
MNNNFMQKEFPLNTLILFYIISLKLEGAFAERRPACIARDHLEDEPEDRRSPPDI